MATGGCWIHCLLALPSACALGMSTSLQVQSPRWSWDHPVPKHSHKELQLDTPHRHSAHRHRKFHRLPTSFRKSMSLPSLLHSTKQDLQKKETDYVITPTLTLPNHQHFTSTQPPPLCCSTHACLPFIHSFAVTPGRWLVSAAQLKLISLTVTLLKVPLVCSSFIMQLEYNIFMGSWWRFDNVGWYNCSSEGNSVGLMLD